MTWVNSMTFRANIIQYMYIVFSSNGLVSRLEAPIEIICALDGRGPHE